MYVRLVSDRPGFGWVFGATTHPPIVDDYPGMRLDCLRNKAKIVYEFDAADVPGHVMYPAMAEPFGGGGPDCHSVSYDPTPLAAFNYGWQTHYLNLVYVLPRRSVLPLRPRCFAAHPV